MQYAITSSASRRASPERLLDLWCGRWRSRTACSGVRCRVAKMPANRQRHRPAVDEPDQERRDEHTRALKVPNLFHKLGINTK
ncbi:MAG: hypothetical protein R3C02_04815 [Planctomycetaceae bacterium]